MEIWEEIKGYEGKYRVSNLGNVKSLWMWTGDKYIRRDKLLRGVLNKNGYLYVSLSKNGQVKRFKVNRLVAEAFIDNPYNLPITNHKDGNKTNNCVNNLEWCTYSENLSHAYKIGLRKSIHIKNI